MVSRRAISLFAAPEARSRRISRSRPVSSAVPAQARRLGHHIPDKIQHVYSHVAPELEARLLEALQQRWTAPLAELAASSWATAVAYHRALPPPDTPGAASSQRYQSAS